MDEPPRLRLPSHADGTLGGLLLALHARDRGLMRHAAAVARLTRDIAKLGGLTDEECGLGYRAGLVHDIGHLRLSERVLTAGGGRLLDRDWLAIHEHPAVAADLAARVPACRGVSEVVFAHHERIDGRGYPRGLAAGEIPDLAKILAVAEVYDTLTGGTYRSRVSSFAALRELRRVAGTQLDGRWVEVLGRLLSGKDLCYRHGAGATLELE